MVRTAVSVFTQLSDDTIPSIVPTTIDSGLVTAGINVVDALNHKNGCTRIRVQNTAVTDKIMTIRAGQFNQAIGGDVEITVPASSVMGYLLNKVEGQIKRFDGSINIDFATGFTGAIEFTSESLHILEVS